MSWLRLPQVKGTRHQAGAEACAQDTTDRAFWYATSLARRIANSHPQASFRSLPLEDLCEAGLIQDEDPELYATMRQAVYFANDRLGKTLQADLNLSFRGLHCSNSQDTESGGNSAANELFDRNAKDTISTLWRDQSGEILALLKPTEGKAVSESASVWVVSLSEHSEAEERSNAYKLQEFGLTASLSDTENPSVSSSFLLTKGKSDHGEKMLFGTMKKGMAREHSDISMKAAAFRRNSGSYQSLNPLPSMFVWVEHAYVEA